MGKYSKRRNKVVYLKNARSFKYICPLKIMRFERSLMPSQWKRYKPSTTYTVSAPAHTPSGYSSAVLVHWLVSSLMAFPVLLHFSGEFAERMKSTTYMNSTAFGWMIQSYATEKVI